MDPIRATDDLTRAVSSWFKTAVHRAAFPPARRLASRENPLSLTVSQISVSVPSRAAWATR
jgi:hypothetical protein